MIKVGILSRIRKTAKINDAIKATDVCVYYINYYIDGDDAKKLHTVSVVDRSIKSAVDRVKLTVRDKTGEEIMVRDVSCL